MRHPHQQYDEVFMGNHTTESFHRIPWKTKKCGLQAFDSEGKEIDIHAGINPVFVDKAEVQAAFEKGPNGSPKKDNYAYTLEHGTVRSN